MTYHPQEHDNMSITHCQIDRSSDTCTPHEHKSLDDFANKMESAELAAAIRTLHHLGYTWNGGEQWRPPLGKKPDFDWIDANRAAAVAEAVAKERERCAFFIRQSIQQCKESGEKAKAAGKHHMVITMDGTASILGFSLDEILCVFDDPKDTP